MEHGKMKHKHIISYLLILNLLRPSIGYPFFGMDAAALIPFLTQQLTVMQQGLSTAQDSLGRLEDLNRGITSQRSYNLRHPFLALARADVRNLATLPTLPQLDSLLDTLYP